MSELPGGQLGACFSLNLQHRMRLRKCWDDEAAGDVEKSSDKQEGRPGLGGHRWMVRMLMREPSYG